jgi:hypothetical protein
VACAALTAIATDCDTTACFLRKSALLRHTFGLCLQHDMVIRFQIQPFGNYGSSSRYTCTLINLDS